MRNVIIRSHFIRVSVLIGCLAYPGLSAQMVYTAQFGSTASYVDATIRFTVATSPSGIAVDRAGNVYVAGTAYVWHGNTLPLVHPVQSTCYGGSCAFVAKLSADGRTVLYATFIGSPIWQPSGPPNPPPYVPAAIASDPDGNVYVTGTTDATKFPQVSGGAAQSAGGNDAFVAKLDSDGVLRATMLIGGSGDDAGTSIALGPDGYLYIAGITASKDFPILQSPFAPPISTPPGVFVLKVDPRQLSGDTPPFHALTYSAVFGGAAPAGGTTAIAADGQGNVYVGVSGYSLGLGIGGSTASAQLARIDPNGRQLAYIPFPTGSGPTAQDLYKPFLSKLKPGGNGVVYSTYLSGDGSEGLLGLAVDDAGNAYVSGITYSNLFPVHSSFQSGLINSFCYGYHTGTDLAVIQGYCTPKAGFVTAVNPGGSGTLWSTFTRDGGVVALDTSGNVYVAGGGVSITKISALGLPVPIDSIVNAASFHPGLPFPGGLATMFVHGLNLPADLAATELPLPAELGGISVRVNDFSAPILAVANIGPPGAPASQQINFQVPFEAPPDGSIATVELVYQGVTTSAVPVRVAPGIFTLADGSGAIEHGSDGSLVTAASPAQRGEVVSVYMTGLGAVSPPVQTGVAPVGPAAVHYCNSPPTATVGDILYAGVTPGYPGLYQMNIRISPGVPVGNNELEIKWSNCWVNAGFPYPILANDSLSNTVILPVQ